MVIPRVLIVDDHEAVREALAARLRVAGVEVIGCAGGWESCLQAVEASRPDVILVETKRADGQGLELLGRLTQEFPYASVVVLTSYYSAGEEVESNRLGAARYLLKQIDTPQLVREILASLRPRAMI